MGVVCARSGSEGNWVIVADKGSVGGAEVGRVDDEAEAKWTFLLANVEKLPC